ncbi:hypothetical protein Y032_0089g2225 [Ancylostoma ceylanicum]|uniref:Uncharacterized protein n=1 Tax=Ancylostoma ceylanicum TaxID=53326 RepID=A0A016TN95_9BILA|nr:hypothetical protein Y032_0089g2225 [Ancylostoma ceylanicum]
MEANNILVVSSLGYEAEIRRTAKPEIRKWVQVENALTLIILVQSPKFQGIFKVSTYARLWPTGKDNFL